MGDRRLHFGLGSKTKADLIEVRWPSGLTESVENISANQLIVIVEGREAARTMKFRAV